MWFFYLARAYQLNKNFDEAIKTFKKYMRMDITQEDKETAQRYLSQCENAKKLASDVNEKDIHRSCRTANQYALS